MSTPLICIALLGFLVVGLGFAVSMTRSKTETNFGSNTDPEDILYKMTRAHGNTAEYAPIIALLIFVLSQSSQSEWVIWCMILATFFRYLIVAGIIFPKTMDTANPMRFIGALGTYLTGFGLCAAVLLQALNT
jgi:uncharacterized membrane protein YecN with MAPEG domain